MSALVRHFGDLADSQSSCGLCDFCAPEECVAQLFRPATQGERTKLARIVKELRMSGARSTGRLHAELNPNRETTRDVFEELLGALARAGIVQLQDASFEKDGRQIPYRVARLTEAGLKLKDATAITFLLKQETPGSTKRSRKKKAAGPRRAGYFFFQVISCPPWCRVTSVTWPEASLAKSNCASTTFKKNEVGLWAKIGNLG